MRLVQHVPNKKFSSSLVVFNVNFDFLIILNLFFYVDEFS